MIRGRSRLFRWMHGGWSHLGKCHRGLFSFHGRYASAIGYRDTRWPNKEA